MDVYFRRNGRLLVIARPLLFGFGVIFCDVGIGRNLNVTVGSGGRCFVFPRGLFFQFRSCLDRCTHVHIQGQGIHGRLVLFEVEVGMEVSRDIVRSLSSLGQGLFTSSNSGHLTMELFNQRSSDRVFGASFVVRPLGGLGLTEDRSLTNGHLAFYLDLAGSISVNRVGSGAVGRFSLRGGRISVLRGRAKWGRRALGGVRGGQSLLSGLQFQPT